MDQQLILRISLLPSDFLEKEITVAVPILLYGCDTVDVTVQCLSLTARIETTEVRFLRRMLGVSFTDVI